VFVPEVDATQQQEYLIPVYFPCLGISGWPRKAIFLKSLHPQAKTVTIPIQNLQDLTVAATEQEKVAGEWLQLHFRFSYDRKAVNLLPHVRDSGPHKDFYPLKINGHR
jgi:hypothetical protein